MSESNKLRETERRLHQAESRAGQLKHEVMSLKMRLDEQRILGENALCLATIAVQCKRRPLTVWGCQLVVSTREPKETASAEADENLDPSKAGLLPAAAPTTSRPLGATQKVKLKRRGPPTTAAPLVEHKEDDSCEQRLESADGTAEIQEEPCSPPAPVLQEKVIQTKASRASPGVTKAPAKSAHEVIEVSSANVHQASE